MGLDRSGLLHHIRRVRSAIAPVSDVRARRNRLTDAGLLTIDRCTYGCPDVRAYPGDTERVVIGSFCSIAEDVLIFVGGNHPTGWISIFPFRAAFHLPGALEDGCPASKGSVAIGHDVWVGARVTILSGVTIGNGAIIGAGAVVASDVRAYSVVVGNPAREVRRRFTDAVVEQLEALQWWDWTIDQIISNVKLLSSDNIDRFLAEAKNRSTANGPRLRLGRTS